MAVTSTSSLAQKVSSLSVNVLGNRCDKYALDLPGMSRSKVVFRYGVNSSLADGVNDGYSHISQVARKHFFLRKEMDTERRATGSSTPLDQNNWRMSNVA